jgi:hypothetical protein
MFDFFLDIWQETGVLCRVVMRSELAAAVWALW